MSTTALAAKRATTTIPVVVPAVGDPVAAGLVTSLAPPGGNVQGRTLVWDIGGVIPLEEQIAIEAMKLVWRRPTSSSGRVTSPLREP